MSDDEDLRTLFCANLAENVTDALLYELFLQVKFVRHTGIFILKIKSKIK